MVQGNPSSSQAVQFVSLVSRNDRPLYIQAFDLPSTETPDSANKFLKYNFLSHMALDVFSSPSSLSLREQQQQQQGEDSNGVILLFIQDEVTVYGYETNNGLKIILGLGNPNSDNPNESSATASNQDLKDLVYQIHKCYLRTIFNPFNAIHESEDPEENNTVLQSKTFEKNIHRIIGGWNGIV